MRRTPRLVIFLCRSTLRFLFFVKNLGDFFDKFKRFSKPDEAIRRKTQETIFEFLRIEIPFENISFKNRTICIKGGGALRQEIAVHKEKILLRLRESFASYHIDDIR